MADFEQVLLINFVVQDNQDISPHMIVKLLGKRKYLF